MRGSGAQRPLTAAALCFTIYPFSHSRQFFTGSPFPSFQPASRHRSRKYFLFCCEFHRKNIRHIVKSSLISSGLR